MANEFLSISDFARLARVTRSILLHYDRIGLLSPQARGENGYRFYATGQLGAVNLIRTLQELGLPLSEIKKLKDQRTPIRTSELLKQLLKKIDKKVAFWLSSQKLLFTILQAMLPVLNVDENAIAIQFLPQEPIILGDSNDYRKGENDYDAIRRFYRSAHDRYPDLDLNYPVWAIFSEERIKRGEWIWPDRYYFYNPAGMDHKPAALYAVGYTRGGYGQTGELYKRLIDYIERNGYEICGEAYEEYPLNEICVADEGNYLIRVMITVREQNTKQALPDRPVTFSC